MERLHLTAGHWGVQEVEHVDGRVELRPYRHDPEPSPIGRALADLVESPLRVQRPSVRRGFLDGTSRGPTDRRGREPFVEVSWEQASELVAREWDRVLRTRGPQARYAGSYGWASAGRFHHAPSQLRRFAALAGGYTGHLNTYSFAAAEVLLPHVIGTFVTLQQQHTTWPTLARNCDLIVSFGGIPLRNTQIESGGVSRHTARAGLLACREAGVELVVISPVRDDAPGWYGATWLPARPGTDLAVMLGLAHVLYTEGLHDEDFLDRYCVGFERFVPYLTGLSDGCPKTPEWASAISGLEAESIRALAHKMAAGATMLNVAWALQRAHHGEQPFWMIIVLAAMLGQIGTVGGGFGLGYGAVNRLGNTGRPFLVPGVPIPANPARSAIPVARIADLLLQPGETIPYDGRSITFPEIDLVHWAGGNPFHHHQDLNRLRRAWGRPSTVIVHEQFWTATARHADIVLPATTTLERDDIANAALDPTVVAMKQAMEPVADARDDHTILVGIADRLGFSSEMTDRRDATGWLRELWHRARKLAGSSGIAIPDFDEFWEAGRFEVPGRDDEQVLLSAFREDPERNPLRNPIRAHPDPLSGVGRSLLRGLPGCADMARAPGVARCVARRAVPASSRLQPACEPVAQSARSRRAELGDQGGPARAGQDQPRDAHARQICDGDVVRLFNDRGHCLAGAVVSDQVMAGVVQLSTGAWYDPDPDDPAGPERHGNPNVLTLDIATSSLAQGPSANTCLVEMERWEGEVPDVTVHRPPELC